MTSTTAPLPPVTTTATAPVPAPLAAPADLATIKARQQAMWASGDYAVVGVTLQIVSELLCEAANLRAGERVLDVATGNGATALAAARRHCRVTGADYVPALLEQAAARAAADGLVIAFDDADAEALPYADASFDAVTSTFGVMFTPDHRRAAAELLRVTRPGGRIALANWTPDGFVGRLFATVGAHVPPPPGLTPPARWGTEAHVRDLFADGVTEVRAETMTYTFRYASPQHFLDVFAAYYGPVLKAFEAAGESGRDALTRDLLGLLRSASVDEATLVVPSTYLQIIATRS